MTSLFGIPVDVLLVVLTAAFAMVMGAMAVLALRSPILFRLGLRKIPRNWGRTGLIVAGLMLGTAIIAAALSTGDTMAHTFRNTARDSLGRIDEIVASARLQDGLAGAGEDVYFDEAIFDSLSEAVAGIEAVDGVAPAIIETVAARNLTNQQTEPRIGLFAADPARMNGFGDIRTEAGEVVTLAELGSGELFLNRDAAEELDASVGHEIAVLAGGEARTFRVAAVVEYEGSGTADAALLVPLGVAQDLLGVPGRIRQILVSNRGGPLDGVVHTDEVVARLAPALEGTGLKAHPVKQDAVDLAQDVALAFTGFFATFGMFSIVAGVLLIFLLFVMLAAERRPEMGIARAVGTQRDQVVRMFLYEGLAYDLVAAAAGALAGVVIAYLMVFALAQAIGNMGVDIEHDARLQSLAIAYLLGVFLTFSTVAISAWRVSSLNIVAAVRDLPDRSFGRGGSRHWWLAFPALLLGSLLATYGVVLRDYGLLSLGLTVAIAAVAPVARRVGVPERLAFTVPGLAIVAWFLLPFSLVERVLPNLAYEFSAFVLVGVAAVLGATWVIMFNADLLIAAMMATAGRVRALAPVLKTAVARPLTNRFRTGMTIAMFGLVVLTVVATSLTTTAVRRGLNDVERFGGGFDLRATVLPTSPIADLAGAMAESAALDPRMFSTVANQSTLALEARQAGTAQDSVLFPVLGFDAGFFDSAPYRLATRARGYESDAAVWEALRSEPGTAVITPLVVPARGGTILAAGLPDFRLEGFYVDDPSFDAVQVEVRDPQTGAATTLTVIGVLSYVIPDEFLTGIVTGQGQLSATFGAPAVPTAYWLALDDGVAAKPVAADLEAAFFDHGMEVDIIQEVLDDVVASNATFTYLVQGFLGLGLIVGVAALAVISARSVVERRRDLAVLRSIGFQRWMIYLLVLVETSFIALLGIGLGFLLGVVISYGLIDMISGQPGWQGVTFVVPWLNLVLIFVSVYVAAVLTALLPAARAANVYPAEALRYE